MSEEIYYCPECGNKMTYIGGLLDWECQKCGIEGSLEWDHVNNESRMRIAKEYTYEEIYADPVGNQPECCKSCGCSAYPDCLSSCKIFDD